MTTPFLEAPRFPDDLARWALGGVNYSTIVIGSTSGRESRNSLWQYGRGQWDLQNIERAEGVAGNLYALQTLRNFFRVCKGQAYGFRFRDFTDYTDEGSGIFGLPLSSMPTGTAPLGVGSGVPVYQMYKQYVASPLADYRVIQKPYPGSVTIKRNGATAAGASLDTTTGLATFSADSSSTISSASAAAQCVLAVATVPTGAVAGRLIYVTGVSGTIGTAINSAAWSIVNVSGTNITIAANTTGLTGGSGGVAAMYPQASDALTWTGQFDTPCRFATDAFEPVFDAGGLYSFQSLKIVEIRL
ncbi:hypothetical protein WK59_10355 [Burkholderia ubonensis]|uniref:DUF2460 domain-containing protein n=1 Tax=Burkholderia ubonensis TaxID=101571 RepID=UPI0007576485|nr:DUF2460 domain-containing protein [Burkholderia ubonensis]KVT86394.1 hypothetical protein WK59_10355 [Burkholderia ubonensis]